MSRYTNVMFTVFWRRQAQMTSGLTRDLVPKRSQAFASSAPDRSRGNFILR
jgi:hypothetical protein